MLVVAEFMPVTVLAPDGRVGPLTLMTYPNPALVLAAIWELAIAVSVGLNSWLKLIAPDVAVPQSGTLLVVLTVPPAQKTKDSGMVPLRIICSAVLAATEPVSVVPPVVFVLA